MALSYSLSLSAPRPSLLCMARTDAFENRFTATLGNLVIIYTNCFWIKQRHIKQALMSLRGEGRALGAMRAPQDSDGLHWGFFCYALGFPSSSGTVKWKISRFFSFFFFSHHHFHPISFCISPLSPNSEKKNKKTIQSVMRLPPQKSGAVHLLAGEWEEQLWTQTTAWEPQCRCLST